MVKPQEDPPLNLNMVVIWIHVVCDAIKDLVQLLFADREGDMPV